MELLEGLIEELKPGISLQISIDNTTGQFEQLTSTVLPAPWTPLSPRKNGGVLFESFP